MPFEGSHGIDSKTEKSESLPQSLECYRNVEEHFEPEAIDANPAAHGEPSFSVDRTEFCGNVLLHFRGILDDSSNLKMRKAIADALPDERTPIIVSLEGIEYLNSDGAGVLFELWKDSPYILCRIPGRLRPLLEQLGLLDVIPSSDSDKAAVELVGELHLGREASYKWKENYSEVPLTKGTVVEAMADLTFQQFDRKEYMHLELHGTLDGRTAMERENEFTAMIIGSQKPTLVDLTALEAMNSAGLAIFNVQEDVDLVILATAKDYETLQSVGVARFYPLFVRAEEAVNAARAPYVASERSNKLHMRSCRYARGIKPASRVFMDAAAIEEGSLARCTYCLNE